MTAIAPQRRRLPNRRPHLVLNFEHGGFAYTAGIRFFDEAGLHPAEIFLTTAKHGTVLDTNARDAAAGQVGKFCSDLCAFSCGQSRIRQKRLALAGSSETVARDSAIAFLALQHCADVKMIHERGLSDENGLHPRLYSRT